MNLTDIQPVKIRIDFTTPLPLYVADVLRRYCGMLAQCRAMDICTEAEFHKLLSEVSAYVEANPNEVNENSSH